MDFPERALHKGKHTSFEEGWGQPGKQCEQVESQSKERKKEYVVLKLPCYFHKKKVLSFGRTNGYQIKVGSWRWMQFLYGELAPGFINCPFLCINGVNKFVVF